ncbi:unnamed protein product [Polarella glacialis]|uniref:Uncharacterized protein n=1 Tax=Polarella glacialis TaxID=89957 RepID=A0A813H922_POLGL|nr:unnamed protein product [Polarella glacialis]
MQRIQRSMLQRSTQAKRATLEVSCKWKISRDQAKSLRPETYFCRPRQQAGLTLDSDRILHSMSLRLVQFREEALCVEFNFKDAFQVALDKELEHKTALKTARENLPKELEDTENNWKKLNIHSLGDVSSEQEDACGHQEGE